MDTPVTPSPWRHPRWRVALLAALLAALIGAVLSGLQTLRSANARISEFAFANVELATFHDFVPIRGVIVPRDIVYLDAIEGGRVQRLLVESGDYVSAGQELIEFGNTELQLEIIERETRLIEQVNYLRNTERDLEGVRVQNESRLRDVEYNITRLTRQVKRQSSLAASGAASAEDKDKVADELAYYQGLRPLLAESLRTQEAMRVRRMPEIAMALAKMEQNLAITRGKLDSLIVRAAVSGRITDLELKVGETCVRGQRLAQITPQTGFKVSAQVDEFYLGRFNVGDVAEVELRGGASKLTVSRTSPKVADGRFAVDLEFVDETPSDLASGQALQGRIQLGEDSQATVIPAGAFLERTGGDWIFVVSEDGSAATRRHIRVGRRNPEQLEILSGLKPGERVIISDYRGVERLERLELKH